MNIMTGKGDSSVSNDSPIVNSVAINPNPTPNVVGRSESNMEFNYEAFNTTLTSVEGVADFFGVPLKTQTTSVRWTTLMELKSTTLELGGSPKMFASVLNPRLGMAEKPKMMSANSFDSVITKPSEVSPSDPIAKSVDIDEKPSSFVGATGASVKDQQKVNSNFRPLVADPVFDGVNISIPCKVVKKVSTRLEHTLYGYFIGKRMTFLVVEYYARNNWAKHGLKRIMMNTKGFFFFKFDSRVGLEAVLEGGPWLIRKSPIILKKWSMDTRLLTEELTRILIWVKLHYVHIQVFEEDDISLIATFIGKPVMLDSYTSSMCNDSWGRSSFARCLIEVNSEANLVDVVTIGVPSLMGDDFTRETIHVEYEWRPPKCDVCKIFGHLHDHCPKKEASPLIVSTLDVVTPTVEKTNDGYTFCSDLLHLKETKCCLNFSFMAKCARRNVSLPLEKCARRMCKEKCVTAFGEMCKEKCVTALGEMCKEKCVTVT
uniref:Zinc knuckle CX2CX4HX4C n=1 Tax=Tanacetum cinerariifolium TaxID=118510 RepID=A0A6L2P398_TANCI|nr:zinc knuckle CX2CX4HX4C [Tanacetum cinerariifolium]